MPESVGRSVKAVSGKNCVSEDPPFKEHAVNTKQKASKQGQRAGSQYLEWTPTTTTIMMRNIQNRYTPEELLDEMCSRGLGGAFDFFYLPTDFATKKNKGYAFVNFATPATAQQFREEFDNKALPRYQTTHKVVEMSAAETQGLYANAHKYLKQQAHRVLNPWFKPIIFKEVNNEVIGYPLCAEYLPKDDPKNNSLDTRPSTATKDGVCTPWGVSQKCSAEQDFGVEKHANDGDGDEFVGDLNVFRALVEAAVLEICQPIQYQ